MDFSFVFSGKSFVFLSWLVEGVPIKLGGWNFLWLLMTLYVLGKPSVLIQNKTFWNFEHPYPPPPCRSFWYLPLLDKSSHGMSNERGLKGSHIYMFMMRRRDQILKRNRDQTLFDRMENLYTIFSDWGEYIQILQIWEYW